MRVEKASLAGASVAQTAGKVKAGYDRSGHRSSAV